MPRRALLADEQRLLSVLERAGGDLVTLDQLHDAGFPRPAILIYDLVMAGCAVENVPASGAAGVSGARLRSTAGQRETGDHGGRGEGSARELER